MFNPQEAEGELTVEEIILLGRINNVIEGLKNGLYLRLNSSCFCKSRRHS